MDLPGGLSHGDSREEAVRVFQKLDYRVVRGSGHLIMSNGERRNGLAATDVGPQLDHRFTAQAVETQEGNAQQIHQTLGDEGAAEELDRVGVCVAANAAMHQIEISGELGLLVATVDHLPPGHQARHRNRS